MDFGLDTLVRDAWRQADRHFEAVRKYPYHHRGHSEGVLRRTIELCDAEKISDGVREEIAVAAIFHDTGYSRAYSHNEPIGAEFARDFLVRR
jgi:HD superfamily phosphodiesterase